jgi:hypothetical protein
MPLLQLRQIARLLQPDLTDEPGGGLGTAR